MTTGRAQTLILSMIIVALALETNMVTRLVNLTKLAINGSGSSTTGSCPPGAIPAGANNSCPAGYAYQANGCNMCVPLIASSQTSSSTGSVSTPPIQNYNPGGLPTVSL